MTLGVRPNLRAFLAARACCKAAVAELEAGGKPWPAERVRGALDALMRALDADDAFTFDRTDFAAAGFTVIRATRCGLDVSLVESAKLAGVDPYAYLRAATAAALAGDTVPLPHEIAAS